ncbi:hypothetical protein Q8W71_16900 [Methylobacterium sp. NEAU 140]|uniref:hypothetical protein n=1 Tax=Methylobacterium sp. NEAU 140 TaxID=3064945 RepID=UPI002736D051|nr:hypothetical protein [Methylobacterium sp. NEAU 140]MDP4024307.1 hypothetical protein [Methylobacterium sp. NEAU 140]
MTRLVLALLAALAATPACAEPATARFRGTVVSRDGEVLVIRRPGGSTLTLTMNAKTRVFAAIGARARDIKPESYLAVVADGGPAPEQADQVTLFSPSERGFEAGRQPWDTAPGASLTAGWIADIRGTGTRRVTLSYEGGHSAFEIAPGTPVTQIGPGEKALLQPGAAVTVFTHAAPDGALQADVVAVGRQGVVPTL